MPYPDSNKIFEIQSDAQFNELAISIFNFQYTHNRVYRSFCTSLKIQPESIVHYFQIPFLPVSFFKTHDVLVGNRDENTVVFTSSATSSQNPSRHLVKDISVYEKSFLKGFELFYGHPVDYTILALLPGYLERKGSSLIYMFSKLIELSKNKNSGFFLHNTEELIKIIGKQKEEHKKTILIGVTYALLDLAGNETQLNDDLIVMETGGMKGKREELLKEELHLKLQSELGVTSIHSEYGMTEALSQAYSYGKGLFSTPPWMKVLIRDVNDPLSYVSGNKTGGINIIDLANIYSCSFIATEDLGRSSTKGFEIMGRFDNSEIRGCNLMIE